MTGQPTRADVPRLLDRVHELEETLLAAAELLHPEEYWGPRPDGDPLVHEDLLSELVHETAADIRDTREAEGWRRG